MCGLISTSSFRWLLVVGCWWVLLMFWSNWGKLMIVLQKIKKKKRKITNDEV